MNFGIALEAAKQGKLIQRAGWNGKGMFVFQRPSDKLSVDFIISTVKSLPQSVKDFFGAATKADQHEGKTIGLLDNVNFTAYLCMYAADGSIVNGWLASQTDMLAEDWTILE